MTVIDTQMVGGWLKGTTLGEPDGPMRFIETFGFEVPTFIDPRLDLKNLDPKSENGAKRVDYHIPFSKRGKFKIHDWPEDYARRNARQRIDLEGYVLCNGINNAGLPCARVAVNRTHFCAAHGGALHLADKKLSIETNVNLPQDRIEAMDRPQQFMQGFLSVEDLEDDEIKGRFIRNKAGKEVKARALGVKFEQEITREFHRRINEYLISKTPKALEVLTEIIESDMVEPADRLKAIGMLTDRTMGKPADVIIHGTTSKPYETILDSIENGGTREDYRKRVASSRPVGEIEQNQTPLDAEVEYDIENEDEEFDSLERSVLVRDRENQESGKVRLVNSSRNDNSSSSSSGDEDENSTLGYVDEIMAKRAHVKEAKKRIQDAKKKRFAARAVGASSIDAIPFGLEFHIIKKGSMVGKLRMKLVAPSQLTEARVARMASVNETTDLALSLLYGDEQG
mgnify:CR=1 FL=1